MRVPLTAIYEPVENGWTQARIQEIPGVITAAPTREEAKEMLLDALREYLLAFEETARTVPAADSHSERIELVVEVGA